MMRLPKFAYMEPRSLEEASAVLAEHGSHSRLIAGARPSALHELGLAAPEWLVSTRHLPHLDTVEFDGASGLRIGASVTLNVLERHPVVQEKFPPSRLLRAA